MMTNEEKALMYRKWSYTHQCYVNQTYDYWEEILRNTRKRKIGNNTWLENMNGPPYPKKEGDVKDICIYYHGSRIVTLHRGGDYTIDFCGWQTQTTKRRINEFGPCYIWSDGGYWFFRFGGETFNFDQRLRISDGRVYDEDGMKVDPVDHITLVREHKRELARIRRKHWGIRRSNVYKTYTIDDWVANFMLNMNRTIQWVHQCEANETDKYAAIGRKVKRCKLCHTELDRGLRMAVELQKVNR